MTEDESVLLREKGLSFFGAITASLSHEINNVVAIIGELSGLFDDLLSGAEQRPVDNEKLRDLSEKIAKQVNKGKGIIRRLNLFAHSVDEPVKDFDLNEILSQIASIAERFAFLKGVDLKADLDAGPVTIRSSPFYLQQAVFIGIELALTASKKNDLVSLTYKQTGSGAEINLTSAPMPKTEEVDAKLSLLSALIRQLGGELAVAGDSEDKSTLKLSVPRSTPAGDICPGSGENSYYGQDVID